MWWPSSNTSGPPPDFSGRCRQAMALSGTSQAVALRPRVALDADRERRADGVVRDQLPRLYDRGVEHEVLEHLERAVRGLRRGDQAVGLRERDAHRLLEARRSCRRRRPSAPLRGASGGGAGSRRGPRPGGRAGHRCRRRRQRRPGPRLPPARPPAPGPRRRAPRSAPADWPDTRWRADRRCGPYPRCLYRWDRSACLFQLPSRLRSDTPATRGRPASPMRCEGRRSPRHRATRAAGAKSGSPVCSRVISRRDRPVFVDTARSDAVH